MEIEIQITNSPIAGKTLSPASGAEGAWLEFRGMENGKSIDALEYEACTEMAEREIQRLLETLAAKHPCLAARVIHRLGIIPVGETVIYVGVAGRHRNEAITLIAEFMDRLKQDVPIWKRRALPVKTRRVELPFGSNASKLTTCQTAVRSSSSNPSTKPSRKSVRGSPTRFGKPQSRFQTFCADVRPRRASHFRAEIHKARPSVFLNSDGWESVFS
jgi:molybdopterin synthase catalytic subunit